MRLSQQGRLPKLLCVFSIKICLWKLDSE